MGGGGYLEGEFVEQRKNSKLLRKSEKKNSGIHLSAEDRSEIKRIYYTIMKHNRNPHIADIMDKVLELPNFKYLWNDWDAWDELTIAVAKYLKDSKLSYSIYDSEDTYEFVPEYKESRTPSKRMREGVGAGYELSFYDIKISNVKEIKVEESTDYNIIHFTANIVPGKYDFSAEHSYWYIDSRQDENGHAISNFVEKAEIIKGTIEGVYFAEKDEDDDWDEYLESKEYCISDIYSGGWIHTPIYENIIIENEKYGISDNNDYCDFYLADITFSKDTVDMMNDCMGVASHPYKYGYEDDEEFEESLSWEKNNMLLKESLPVEDRHEYQKWQKDFKDNETNRRDAKRKQILEDKCGLYFNTIYSELDYVHIDNEALYGIVSESIVYKEDSCENRIGSIGGFPEGVYDVYTSFYEDNYDFKRHSSKENLVHFLESPFYVFFQDSLENEEDDMRRQLSKKGYRQLASLINKKVVKCIPMTQRADNQEFEGFGVYFPLESLKDRDTVCDLLDAFYEMNTVYEENM